MKERERDRREQKETIFRGHPLFEFEFKYKRRARFKDRVNDSQNLRDHFSICLETLFIYSRRKYSKIREKKRDMKKKLIIIKHQLYSINKIIILKKII